MSQKYRISYKHQDMPPDYTGMKTIWANDEKKALQLLTGRVTKVGQWTPAKSGAVLKVISVEDAT